MVEYIDKAKQLIEDSHLKIGDKIEIETNMGAYKGILMPRSHYEGAGDYIVLKLKNGYNIGISIEKIKSIRLIEKRKSTSVKSQKITHKKGLPHIVLISTGGTISSKVDYATGAVSPALSAEDLYLAVPELRELVNIDVDVLFNELSENITPKHWEKLSKVVYDHILSGVDGVIIAHGTDTLGYTAAALSFGIQNLPVPVVLVGSQRSSDRPSSDAFINLKSAAIVAGYADLAEVVVVMHGTSSDTPIYVYRGNKVRKMHTSSRNAFKSINIPPIGFVENNKYIENIEPLLRRDKSRKPILKNKFDEKVALLYSHPGLDSSLINFIINNYSGIVIAGTGLGHISSSFLDIFDKAIKNNLVVAMASQCIFGRINMNVYSTGINLQKVGIISSNDMHPETALVKLTWALSNYSRNEAISIFQENLVGEISERTYPGSISNR